MANPIIMGMVVLGRIAGDEVARQNMLTQAGVLEGILEIRESICVVLACCLAHLCERSAYVCV